MGRDKELKSQTCKERYAWYKAHDICTSCGRVNAEPGHVRCKACEKKISVYHEKSREARNERKKQIRAERIAKGLCTECGIRKAIDGKRMCERCRQMRNDSTRKYKIIQRIQRTADRAREASK